MTIRVYSLSAISLGLLGVAIASLSPACASKKDHAAEEFAEAPVSTGSLRMALSARGESGTLYRLRNANFNVQQDNFGFFTTLSTENDPLATTLEATLPVGNFFINIQPDFSSGGNFTLEKVENGSSTRVRATLLSPSQQTFTIRGNEETQVGYRFETNGEVVDFGQGRLVITLDVAERAGEARRTVIETGQDALAGLSLRDTLDAALNNAGSAGLVGAEDVYHAIIDSYSTAPGNDPSLAHCDDQQTNGQASLNGYPLACPRLEGSQFDNIDSWFPVAFVNRLDLAPSDGSNCGQQRIIFANNVFIGNGRMLMIIEAQLPNPTPECGVDSCRPIAEFWSSLATINDPLERGQRLREAFLTSGTGPFAPFMNANQLGPNGGQIRTNNFNSFPWTMREFQMQAAPAILPLPHAVREAPNGELWNDLSSLPQGEACRDSFLASLSNLQSDNLATLGFPVAAACEDAESPNDFSRHDYAGHLASGSGDFAAEIDARVAGSGLNSDEIARRARFAGSCMGCHIESSGVSLGNGVTAPSSNDFVQISEFSSEPCFGSNNGNCFVVSEALRTVFLPHRISVQQNFLNAPAPGCGAPPAGDAGVPVGFPDAGVALVGGTSRSAQRTLGGQPVVDHPH
jgi:hypothetical protein